MFTDYYAEHSCTAGRSTFITGSGDHTHRSFQGRHAGSGRRSAREDMTIAEALKPLGYATGQFGKNHLGDRNEFLPTVHGFDEFFGNLYHFNAEEEPENPTLPEGPRLQGALGPRGVLKCKASDRDDPTSIRSSAVSAGRRLRTPVRLPGSGWKRIDDETTAAAIDFMTRQVAGQPAVLLLDELDPHARHHPRADVDAGSKRHQ